MDGCARKKGHVHTKRVAFSGRGGNSGMIHLIIPLPKVWGVDADGRYSLYSTPNHNDKTHRTGIPTSPLPNPTEKWSPISFMFSPVQSQSPSQSQSTPAAVHVAVENKPPPRSVGVGVDNKRHGARGSGSLFVCSFAYLFLSLQGKGFSCSVSTASAGPGPGGWVWCGGGCGCS